MNNSSHSILNTKRLANPETLQRLIKRGKFKLVEKSKGLTNFCASFRTPSKPGNRKCTRDSCVTCDLLISGSSFRSTMTGKNYKFMPSVSCDSKWVIYLVRGAKHWIGRLFTFPQYVFVYIQVTCDKCKKQYVGKTEQTLRQRHYGHRREIDQESSHLGKHFSGPCGYTSFRIQVLNE